ncbi:MAG: hypothetical protein ABI559_09670 [Chloroflexota bacterium]
MTPSAAAIRWLRTGALLVLLLALAASAGTRDFAQAAFPGTNGKIAFVERDGLNAEIWTMNPDGSERQQITANGAFSTMPSVSPDGGNILYMNFPPANDNFSLHEVSIGTRDDILIPNSVNADSARWSPDASQIAFDFPTQVQSVETMDVWTLTAADGTRTDLTNTSSTDEYQPAWSPDGTKIAYTQKIANCQSCRSDLYVMNANGTGRKQLTNLAASSESRPDWSPDGLSLVFDVSSDGNAFHIARIDADGSH